MAALNVRDLGNFIRDQRRAAQISLRQLARQAGVSNPYLSQIERGLRRPSAEILQQIAKALRISAEVLYVQAGILEERDVDNTVTAAILGDSHLTERQKQVVLDIYQAFRQENVEEIRATGPTTATAESPDAVPAPSIPAPAAPPEQPTPAGGTSAPEAAQAAPGGTGSTEDTVAGTSARTRAATRTQASRTSTSAAKVGSTRAASGASRTTKRRTSTRPPEQDASSTPDAGDTPAAAGTTNRRNAPR